MAQARLLEGAGQEKYVSVWILISFFQIYGQKISLLFQR